jgi:hypothetical protein
MEKQSSLRLTLEQLNQRYGFPLIEHQNAFAAGKLHPVFEKHLEKCWHIEAVYGLVQAGEISLSKARELVAGIIEKQTRKDPSVRAIMSRAKNSCSGLRIRGKLRIAFYTRGYMNGYNRALKDRKAW